MTARCVEEREVYGEVETFKHKPRPVLYLVRGAVTMAVTRLGTEDLAPPAGYGLVPICAWFRSSVPCSRLNKEIRNGGYAMHRVSILATTVVNPP